MGDGVEGASQLGRAHRPEGRIEPVLGVAPESERRVAPGAPGLGQSDPPDPPVLAIDRDGHQPVAL